MEVAEAALARWGIRGETPKLIAARENRVFSVEQRGRRLALRIHRPGYRSDAEVRSELAWIAALEAGGLRVPRPVPADDGTLLQTVNGAQVDLLTWLPGTPIGVTGQPLALDDPAAVFLAIGRELARLHTISDQWQPPTWFVRCAWDRKGLVGSTPVWGKFWENPTLSAAERELFGEVRNVAFRELAAVEATLDYGLIHADLVVENILLSTGRVQFIDFDDGGFGYRLFDIAGALLKHMTEPRFEALKDALMTGYSSERFIDAGSFDLLLLLRACTYIGWIVPRMDEPGAVARNRRLIATASQLAQSYL